MATVPAQAAMTLQQAPITSVQPGGGTCMAIERLWGRVRRGCLRRWRPDYVAKMASKRQGDCPNCPHDIIDSRDLKHYRNVCGYSFRPEDDAFLWRERIGLARMGLAEVICFSLGFATLAVLFFVLTQTVHLFFWIPLAVVLVFWGFIISFFRDPTRAIPTDPAALVSPADGTVTNVDEVPDPDFPGGRAFRISIFLSVFNVHVNRIPRSGKVTDVRYYPGGFLDARHPECGSKNEQLWIDLEDAHGGRKLRIKQVSGMIARRIVCWLRPGETVKRGERLGMIKFGSRTEVFLPLGETHYVQVKVGDKVKGGKTVLLRFG